MERISCPKTRWAWVEVDQAALRFNTHQFRSLAGPRRKLCCVVKADAYGHGAARCAQVMRSAGADMFAVATVGEGVALRESGVTVPVLVLSEPPAEAIPSLLEHDLMPSVYTMDFALAYGESAVNVGKVGRYHLAVDTGMNRIGVPYGEAAEFRRSIDFHRGLACDGVFTHFATADEPAGWDFTLQVRNFEQAIDAMRQAGLDVGTVHCDNTPGSIFSAQTRFDMIRAGIGLYGLHPCDRSRGQLELKPVMSVRARITRVARPAVGEGVSYGFTYRVSRTGVQVCTLPIGYADGLARSLSNRMEVLYRGARARQVGNICMDQCMFALQSTPLRQIGEAEIGEAVTIVGADGDQRITMDEMAGMLGTINYEIACRFGMRLEKLYV